MGFAGDRAPCGGALMGVGAVDLAGEWTIAGLDGFAVGLEGLAAMTALLGRSATLPFAAGLATGFAAGAGFAAAVPFEPDFAAAGAAFPFALPWCPLAFAWCGALPAGFFAAAGVGRLPFAFAGLAAGFFAGDEGFRAAEWAFLERDAEAGGAAERAVDAAMWSGPA
jgi:hypothetical protein